MPADRDDLGAQDDHNDGGQQTAMLDASKVIEILDFQRGIAQELKKSLESGFSRIRQLFYARKLFVLNEPTLDCDALNDHLVPKSVLPIYDAELSRIYNALSAELQQSVQRALTLYAQDIRQSDVTQDVLYILVYKVQLADQSLGELKGYNDQLLESSHGKYKTNFHTINMLKAQIYQAEKFGFVFKPDAVEKPQPSQADISELQNSNRELMLEIYARDELITQFENGLEISLAEFEKLQLDFTAYKRDAFYAENLAKCAENREDGEQPGAYAGLMEANSLEQPNDEALKQYHEAVEDYDERPSHLSATLVSMDNGSAPVAKVDLSVPMLAAAEPEIYLSRGIKAQLTDRQRFRQLIKAGDKHYLDMQTGIDYFKGARGLYGYADANGDFHYTTKDGLLVRIVQGSEDMFIIDEQGQQVVPATYAKRYDRVYVRRNGFKYYVDQFGQKYLMKKEKRIDLDDNFSELKLPFFRQFGFKMYLVAKCYVPEIPQAFVDRNGKVVVEERLQRRYDDDAVIYSAGDGIMYFRDEKGFYYFKDGEKCRRDYNGKIYVFRANFAFCDQDKSLIIGGRRYFFDEKFGYFFFLAEDGSRHVYDRTINCVIDDEMHYSVVSEMSIQHKIQRLQQKDTGNTAKYREHVMPDVSLIEARLQQARPRHLADVNDELEANDYLETDGQSETEGWSDAASANSAEDSTEDEQTYEPAVYIAGQPTERPKKHKSDKNVKKSNKQVESEAVGELNLKASVQDLDSHENVLSNVRTDGKNPYLYVSGLVYRKASKKRLAEEMRLSGQQTIEDEFRPAKPEKIGQPLSNDGLISKVASYSSYNGGVPSQIMQNAKAVRKPQKLTENCGDDTYARATCETIEPTRRSTRYSSGEGQLERDSSSLGAAYKQRTHKRREKLAEASDASQQQGKADSESGIYPSDEESTYEQAFSQQSRTPRQPKLRVAKGRAATAQAYEDQYSAGGTENDESGNDYMASGQDEIRQRDPARKELEKRVFSSPEERNAQRPSENRTTQLNFNKYGRTAVQDSIDNAFKPEADYSLALSGDNAEAEMHPKDAPKHIAEKRERRAAALSAEEQQDAEYLQLLANTERYAVQASAKSAASAALALVCSSGGKSCGKASPLEKLMAECENNDVGCQAGVSYFYKEKHQAVAARSKVMEEVLRVSQLMRSQAAGCASQQQQAKKDHTKTVVTLDPFSVVFEYDRR